MTFLNSLKAKNLKNHPRNYWQKNGYHVSHLANGYWLTYYNYSQNFNTLTELKNHIKNL